MTTIIRSCTFGWQNETARLVLARRTQHLLEQIASTSNNGNGRSQGFTESSRRETFSDPVDEAQWAAQAYQTECEHRTVARQLAQVKYAVKVLDQGKYGVCECCGEPIPADRLEIFPEATLCRPCKLATERNRNSPDEQIFRLVPKCFAKVARVTLARMLKLHWRHAPNERVLELVWNHSLIVATIAEQLRAKFPPLSLDHNDVLSAALVHDIGVYRCIDWCPRFKESMSSYIRHGVIGAHILQYDGLSSDLVRVAERHTGTGITVVEIRKRNLPLPPRDLVPETLLEKLICYADKFHSKRLHFLNLEEVIREQRRFGIEKVQAIIKLREMFGVPDLEPIRAVFEAWQQTFGSPTEL